MTAHKEDAGRTVTPGPYEIAGELTTGSASGYQVLHANGGIIVAMVRKKTDAAFIVRAVNSHADLVFALEQLVCMAVVWETVDQRKNIQLENSEAYLRARAVISKATGATP